MRLRRALLGLALFLAIFAVAAFLLRLPVAGYAVRTALAGAGIEEAQFRVTALSFSGARLENLAAGPAGDEIFRFDFIEADYDWLRLLQHREVNAMRLGPGVVHLVVSPDGKISVPGVAMNGGESGALPFKSLTLSDLALRIDTPEGIATGGANADFDVQKGGQATISLSASKAGMPTLLLENATATADVTFDAEGVAQLKGSLTGDVVAAMATARDATIAVSAKNLLWRKMDAGTKREFAGEAMINIEIEEIPVDQMPLLAAENASRTAAMLGDLPKSLSFSGALAATVAKGGITISQTSTDDPVIVKSDTGVTLVIAGLAETPFITHEKNTDRAAFSYQLLGAKIDAQGEVDAKKTDAKWRILVPMRIGEYRSDRFSVNGAALAVDAIAGPNEFTAGISVDVGLQKAKIGRLNVFAAPFEASFNINADNDTHRIVVTHAKECIKFDNVRATIDRQDTEISLSGAEFCANGDPIAVIDWSDTMLGTFAGHLSTSHARYRLGNTRLIGRPPRLDFTAVYTPSLNQTLANGNVEGGEMALNDLLDLAATTGKFRFSLDKEIMRINLNAEKTRVSQHRELPLVAPVLASVDFELVGQKATFDYVLSSLSRHRIGAGAGVHDVATSAGKSRLVLDRLEFSPGGVQPAALLPVMKGFVREATGGAEGTADFSWTRSGGITASADIQLKDVTFAGPARIVNQTKGLNGNIQFENLWPLTTAGAQSITVEGADLDALKLQSGQITFEMRGDEKLRVETAAFPWFGGALGVDSAVMALSGGEAITPLRAEQIDLGQILEFADFEGLSGEGILSGVLPLVVKDGRARIENGVLKSDSPGAIRYSGRAGEEAAAAGAQAKMAFDLLRDLQFASLVATINGPLDGRLQFQIEMNGTGAIEFNDQDARIPVKYNINLDAAILELLYQANLIRKPELQLQLGVENPD